MQKLEPYNEPRLSSFARTLAISDNSSYLVTLTNSDIKENNFLDAVRYFGENEEAVTAIAYLISNYPEELVKNVSISTIVAACTKIEQKSSQLSNTSLISEETTEELFSRLKPPNLPEILALSSTTKGASFQALAKIVDDIPKSFELPEIYKYFFEGRDTQKSEIIAKAMLTIFQAHPEEAIKAFGAETALVVFVYSNKVLEIDDEDDFDDIFDKIQEVDSTYNFGFIERIFIDNNHSNIDGSTFLKVVELTKLFSKNTNFEIQELGNILDTFKADNSTLTADDIIISPADTTSRRSIIFHIDYKEDKQSTPRTTELHTDGMFTILFSIRGTPVACSSFDVISVETANMVQFQQIVSKPIEHLSEEKIKYPRQLRSLKKNSWAKFVASTTIEILKSLGFKIAIIQGAINNPHTNEMRTTNTSRIRTGQETMSLELAQKIYDQTANDLGFKPFEPKDISLNPYNEGNYYKDLEN